MGTEKTSPVIQEDHFDSEMWRAFDHVSVTPLENMEEDLMARSNTVYSSPPNLPDRPFSLLDMFSPNKFGKPRV